jgi:hypothetical protein
MRRGLSDAAARSRVYYAAAVHRSPSKPFHCPVVNEDVTVSLRRRRSLLGRGDLYVQCSETDCQYVDTNEPPCPLTLDLFAAEIAARERARQE